MAAFLIRSRLASILMSTSLSPAMGRLDFEILIPNHLDAFPADVRSERQPHAEANVEADL
jgi:hypothetical protein